MLDEICMWEGFSRFPLYFLYVDFPLLTFLCYIVGILGCRLASEDSWLLD